MSGIHDYVRQGSIEDVQTYIATGGDINAADKHSRTPLHLAAWAGQYDILQLLLRSKANVDKKAMDGFTALHFAVQSTSPHAAKCVELIGRKAKSLLFQRTSKGSKSALHLAIAKGNESVVQVLLELGLDPESKTGTGQSCLDLAKSASLKALLQDSIERRHNKPHKDDEENGGDDNDDDVDEVDEEKDKEAEAEEDKKVGSKRKRDEEEADHSEE